MTPQQHDRLLALLRQDGWSSADQIKVMNLVRQEFPATLRDEFAAAALTGIMTRKELAADSTLNRADLAYQIANAMLEARKS